MRKRCLLCKELHEYTLSCGILHESSIPMRTVIPLHIVITVISRVPRDACIASLPCKGRGFTTSWRGWSLSRSGLSTFLKQVTVVE
jgi:hypothetical protein